MVLQQRVYATGNSAPSTRTVNSASSRGPGEREPFVGRSQKDFLEQHILRRREAEVGLSDIIQTLFLPISGEEVELLVGDLAIL